MASIPTFTIGREVLDRLAAERHELNPFELCLVSESDVLSCLAGIKSGAVGVDGLSARMLRLGMPYLLPPLLNIINFSLETGQFPEVWKMSLITPIPKKENPSIDDLRPISILPAVSKVLEKIVKFQLVEYIDNHKILPRYQSGFRKNYSCTTALLKVTSDVTGAFDRGQCCPAVLVDMTKAFDTLNVELLIAKLNSYGIDCRGWFSSYLRNRKQAVRLGRHDRVNISEFREVNTGVPQGSILGPVLFSIFTADLPKNIKHCHYHMYADDLQIYLPTESDSLNEAICRINLDLEDLSRWASRNSLLINPSKTQAILFTRSAIEKSHINIKIDNKIVEWKDEIRNLGLLMDTALTFNGHVNGICRRAFFRLKTIYEYRNYLPVQTKKTLTDSLVLSVPSFLDVVYGPYLTEFNKYRIQKIQNSCVRYAKCLPRREHISRHVAELFQTNMGQRRFAHMGCLLHNVVTIQTPDYLCDFIKKRSSLHSVEVRHKDILDIPKHRLEFFKSSFHYLAAHIYNQIPRSIKQKSGSAFKAEIKKLVISGSLML